MASLNGVEIKNLKKFSGHEGEPLNQGTVYYNGRKLGYWSEDSHGGCNHYDFDTKQLEKAFFTYKSKFVGTKSYEYMDVDSFMADVIGFMLLEKEYKKGLKKGDSVIAFSMSLGSGMYSCVSVSSEKEAQQYIGELESNILKYCYGGRAENRLFTKVFKGLDDFNVVIGDESAYLKEKEAEKKRREERIRENERQRAEAQAKEDRLKNNGRFVYKQKGNEPIMIIKDKVVNKTIEVPFYAWKNVLEALVELYVD